MKVEKIIQQLKENKSVSEIGENEKINRHSVSLVKQTLELLEEKHKKELDEKEKIKQKYIEAYNKLLEQNKIKLSISLS